RRPRHPPPLALRPPARPEPVVLARERRDRRRAGRGAHRVPRRGARSGRADRAPDHPADHDHSDRRDGGAHGRPDGLRRPAVRSVREDRRRTAGAGHLDPAGGRPMSPASSVATSVWRQLPFFIWLVTLWMLLWAQFTVLSLLTGIIVALFVTRVFRLPP